MHNVIWISSIMPKFRKKTNDLIPIKHLDRGKGGQTLFLGPLELLLLAQ